MELQLSFNLISSFLFLSLLTLLITKWMKTPKLGRNLPPGPRKLPIIGNIHQLSGPFPHIVLRDLGMKYSNNGLMHLQIGQVSTLVISSADMAKDILKTHDLAFSYRPQLMASEVIFYNTSDIIFSPHGEYWRQLRKVCMMELLSNKMVRNFSHIRYDETRCLMDRVRSLSGKPINVHDEIAWFTSSVVFRAAFGKIFDGSNDLLEILDELSVFIGGFCMVDMFPSWKIFHFLTGEKRKMMKVHKKIDAVVEDIINEHRKNIENGKKGSGESGVEDMVDVLLKLKDSGSLSVPFTNDTIKAIIIDIFGAGTDTSMETITRALVEMMRNPKVLAKAEAEVRQVLGEKKEMLEENVMEQLHYLELVIKETLRLHPPAPLNMRQCNEESVVLGYNIPSNTTLLVNTWAINRDPKYWEDPDSFIPERFENRSIDVNGNSCEYMPFGTGRRICPGISFAWANIQFPLAHLLYHFDWKLPHGMTPETLQLTEMPGLSVGVKNDIFLIATPRTT